MKIFSKRSSPNMNVKKLSALGSGQWIFLTVPWTYLHQCHGALPSTTLLWVLHRYRWLLRCQFDRCLYHFPQHLHRYLQNRRRKYLSLVQMYKIIFGYCDINCHHYFDISQNEIWKFGWNLLLAKFGSERVKEMSGGQFGEFVSAYRGFLALWSIEAASGSLCLLMPHWSQSS